MSVVSVPGGCLLSAPEPAPHPRVLSSMAPSQAASLIWEDPARLHLAWILRLRWGGWMSQVALACVVLSGRWAWLLCGLAVVAYASLFWPAERAAWATPSAQGHLHVHGNHDMQLHLRGMWVAFAVTAALLGVVVSLPIEGDLGA